MSLRTTTMLLAVGLFCTVNVSNAQAFDLLERFANMGASQKSKGCDGCGHAQKSGAAQKGGCGGACQKGGATQKGGCGASQKGCGGACQKGRMWGKGASQKGGCGACQKGGCAEKILHLELLPMKNLVKQ